MKIGETLKRLRLIYGYKASELSEIINISPSYLSEIENGKKQPSLELLENLSNVYGIKLSSLILITEEVEKNDSKTNDLIKKLMNNLILNMSKGINDEDL